jgi:hypothetical protein
MSSNATSQRSRHNQSRAYAHHHSSTVETGFEE